MSKYDEILQIFESQKREIMKLSNKVNELEETNAFLMTILEKSQTLPPVFDPNLLRKDKQLAIEKEFSIKSMKEKHSNIDSTHCETTLNDSFEEHNNRNSLRWSSDSSSFKKSDYISERFQNVSISDEMRPKCCQVRSNLNLRVSNCSPVRNRQSVKSMILCSNDARNSRDDCLSDFENKTGESGSSSKSGREKDLINSVIARCVQDSAETCGVVEKISSKINEFNPFPKLNESFKSSQNFHQSFHHCETRVSPPIDNGNIGKLLDNLIDTLQNQTKQTDNTLDCKSSVSLSQDVSSKSQSIYSDYANKFQFQKDNYISNSNDKHTQLKLLLTAQQLQADLLHQSLEENSKKIFNNSKCSTQINTSNVSQTSILKKPQVKFEDETEESSSKLFEVHPTELQLQRQKELSRLNNTTNFKLFEDPKVKNGFVKFTALIKGYIVRTLRETDKVQNIIVTIKDTAQLAIKLRQERLSGDCQQTEDCNTYNFVTRRNNQEIVSFQQRLVSQLKTALSELHEVFFEWSSALQMRLIRNHIDQLMISGSNHLQNDKENNVSSSSTSYYPKPKINGKLSSATLKRRQKLALRSNNIKENGTKNSNSSTSQRKSVYSSPYGNRGYNIGSHSRATNVQPKASNDRKPRTNYVSRRRGGTRTINKSDINKISTNFKSDYCPTSTKPLKNTNTTIDKPISEEINRKPDRFDESHIQLFKQQQQSQSQSKLLPKTITTSICSTTTASIAPAKSSFINVKSNIQSNLIFHPVANDGDSYDDSYNSNKLSTGTFSTSPVPVQDWKSQTYTLSDNSTLIGDKMSNGTEDSLTKKYTFSENSSNKSPHSNFNENSISRVEVEISDIDMGYLCQNNSHYNDCTDPTESQDIVYVDIAQQFKDVEHDPYQSYKIPTTPSCQNSNNQPSKRSFRFSKHPLKPIANNTVLSNPLNNSRPDFYFSIANNLQPSVTPSQFKIRKRIVACNSLHSSTVSHL